MPRIPVDLIIHNAKQLVTSSGFTQRPATGREMGQLSVLEDGAVAISNGQIVAVSKSRDILDSYDASEKIDASGKIATPGLIDAHTHFVFAGSRETELELKIQGMKYLEILEKGGGILRTVRDTRTASKGELLDGCRKRVSSLLKHGTTTIEAKSGYGLELAAEIKSLEVINSLNEEGPLSLVSTFLGAHAIPQEFEGKVEEYVELICEDWIPRIQQLHLASFCDVFCEKGVFEIEESKRILLAGKRHGLVPRIHADELYPLGGAELAAEIGAASADHLLYASGAGMEKMKQAGVVATLLPAAPLTLMLDRYADARSFMSTGVPIALGSDLSPSCLLENYQLVMALACYMMKMTPAEALIAATINAAHSIRRANQIGSIETGKQADITIFRVPDYRFLGYQLGSNMADTVVKNGKVVVYDGRLK